ncbi:MAG: glutamine amidotransferase [Bacillota bacterium]
MKKLLIIKTGSTFDDLVPQIGDFEDWIMECLGVNRELVHIIDVTTHHEIPDIHLFSGVIITGSHAMVTDKEEWMVKLCEWIKANYRQAVPILGICFGHQIIADSLGGNVDYHKNGIEMGSVQIQLTEAGQNDLLLSCLPHEFMSYAAHSQTVTTLPHGTVVLAYNSFERHHAFRMGRCTWGIQFHPEFNSQAMMAYINRHKNSVGEKSVEEKINFIAWEENPSKILLKRFKDLCFNSGGRL